MSLIVEMENFVMKIGVIGPEITVNVVRRVAERELPDIEFI